MSTKRRTSPAQGRRHHNRRLALKPLVESGCVRCARCGELIAPGAKWDLGHVDGDPTRYSGPEHLGCNRATARHRGERKVSRDWLGSETPRQRGRAEHLLGAGHRSA
jgi:hypothetical protein